MIETRTRRPLRLVIHVVQNHHAGEQGTTGTRQTKEFTIRHSLGCSGTDETKRSHHSPFSHRP